MYKSISILYLNDLNQVVITFENAHYTDKICFNSDSLILSFVTATKHESFAGLIINLQLH